MGRGSKLTLENKLLIYRMVLKPIWTYGIQLWGTASASNTNAIQIQQNIILKALSNAPWFIKNTEVHSFLNLKTVSDEIKLHASRYRERLENHPNKLAAQLTVPNYIKRLKRREIMELCN